MAFISYTAVTASGFLDSIGINGPADATTAAQLAYLGIGHLRTDVATSAALLAAGADGAKVDVIVPWYLRPVTAQDLSTFLTQIDGAASVVEAVEGPNELNTDPDTYAGVGGPQGFEALQTQLYAMVKADPNLSNASRTTAVYDFSVLQGTAPGTYGGMSAAADFNNVHAYGSAGIPPSWIMPYETTHNTIAGAKPVVVTETGATTIEGTGVDQAMQARFDLEALLDDYQLGVVRTYIYNTQDWATGSNATNFSAHYGVYNTDGSIKLAGTALHNFTTILSNGASGAGTPPTALSYTLGGLEYYGNSELFAKSNGTFDLAIWNETAEWNPATGSEIAIPTDQVTLTTANLFATLAVYDPLVSSSPIALAFNTNTITVSLGKDPLIVELVPFASSSVHGSVYLDGGADAGVSVSLLDATGKVIGATTTGATGGYSFIGLPAASGYQLRFAAPKGQALQLGGTANPTTGRTAAFSLAAGQATTLADENLLSNPGTIQGVTSHLGSADPTWGTAQSGVTVELLNLAGTVLATTVTGGGWFKFSGLAAGSYMLEYLAPTGEAMVTGHAVHATTGLSGVYTVAAGANLWTPVAGVTSTSNTFTLTGGGSISLRGAGNYVVTGNASNSRLTLGPGNQSVSLTGTGNVITIGAGTSTVNAGSGGATVHAAGGAVTITAGGAHNLFDAGAGINFMSADGSAGNKFVLNAGGQGLTTISGFNPGTTDVLDLARTLAGTGILADLSNVGSYVTAGTANGSTTLSVDPTGGHGSTTAFAILTGINIDVGGLLNGHHLSL